MNIEKVLALLQVESLSRLHPKLAAITTEAMNQLSTVAEELGGKPKSLEPVAKAEFIEQPKSIPRRGE